MPARTALCFIFAVCLASTTLADDTRASSYVAYHPFEANL
jgi:hypothetical protein